MNNNDRSLLKQMIAAGHFSYDIYQLLVEHNKMRSKEAIAEMGDKWCLHPKHAVKKLAKPL